MGPACRSGVAGDEKRGTEAGVQGVVLGMPAAATRIDAVTTRTAFNRLADKFSHSQAEGEDFTFLTCHAC